MPLSHRIPLIYLITNGKTTDRTTRTSEEFQQIVRLADSSVAAGIDLFQIREKGLTARTLYHLAQAVASRTRGTETRLLINDRADIAAAAGADGVHLAGNSLPCDVVRKSFGDDFLIGVSTHSHNEAKAAKDSGAAFAVFGPVFETESKQTFGPPVGLGQLKEVSFQLSPFPILALGGVRLETIGDCLRAGARGIAAIRLLNDPDDLPRVVAAIRGLA